MSEIVSVIITSYNKAPYLEDALQSVLNQTYSNWEVLIVDDGSTDNTEEIATKFCINDERFKFYKKPNGGASSARNFALNYIKGQYVQFLDGDDIIDSYKFEKQLLQIPTGLKNAVCISDYYCSTENDLKQVSPLNRYKSPEFATNYYLLHLLRDWEVSLSIPIHSFLFDSSFFMKYEIRFDESLVNHEDWDCWLRIFSLHPSVYYSSEKLAVYRICEKSLCADKPMMNKMHLQALYKNIKLFKSDSTLRQILRSRILFELYGRNFETKNDLYVFIVKNKYKKLRLIFKDILSFIR